MFSVSVWTWGGGRSTKSQHLWTRGEGRGGGDKLYQKEGAREGGGAKYTKNKWPFFVDELKVKGSKAENLYPGLNGSKENRIPA